MIKKLLFLLLIFFAGFMLLAQEGDELENVDVVQQRKEDFWIGLNGDAALYSADGFAYGGGLSFGYGSGTTIGLKATWFFGTEGISTLEINVFLRFYFFGADAYSGPFLQIMGGPALFFQLERFSVPSPLGMVCAGLCFGWRFVFGKHFFAEPFIRGGYPFLSGGGVTAGVRF